MNNTINELKDLYDNLTKIKYKSIKNKNIIETHKYNLNLQEETYNNLISYLNNLINNIKENNLEEYYEELIKITTTKNIVPTLEELNISNYISLRSINLNKILTKEINNFYREINEMIDNIQEEQEKQQEKINKIIELNKKIEKIKAEQHIKLKELKQEKIRIENEIENTQIELNKTFIFNIFKKDYLNSKIDLLKQEFNQYEENINKLNKDYKIKIDKEELKIEELKKD